LVALIAKNYPFELPQKEVPEQLNALVNKLKAAGRAHEFSDIRAADKQTQVTWIESIDWRTHEQDAILRVLLKFKLNPASVNANIFPSLSYPSDLRNAIRSVGLEDGKVRELAKLTSARLGVDEQKAEQIRIEAMQQVIDQNLSVRDTRSLVNQAIKQHGSQQPINGTNPTIKLSRSLEKFPVDEADQESLLVLHKTLKAMLSKVEKTLGIPK
jgi:ParB family transcriptional regulator, chromosome partitioning protein